MDRLIRGRPRRTAFIALPAAVAVCALIAPSALAADAWSALSISQCCATSGGSVIEMEAGEGRWSGFVAKNTGLNTWQSTGSVKVRLGTAEARDRKSELFNPGPGAGSWISANRPTTVANAPVGPGGFGIFRFRVLAPDSPRDYKEYFEPVADEGFEGWMGSRISDGCFPDRWCGVHLIYRVRPRVPPSLAVVAAADVVPGPAAFKLTVDAGDNVGLDRVIATLDGDPATTQVEDMPAPDANAFDHPKYGEGGRLVGNRRLQFNFAPSGCSWSRGDHTVKVVAYDLLGQVDQVTKTFSVDPDGDCDGISGTDDKCPSLAAPSPDDADGCPPPSGRAARSTFVLAEPGAGRYRELNKIGDAGVRGVLAGTQVKVYCKPACGRPIKRRARKDTKLFKLKGLIGKVVADETTVVVRATLPRAMNVYGRQWKWLILDGARNRGGECVEPGFAGRDGCR